MGNDLMDAVHDAVVEHGYKDLSVAKIADHYSKGKSNIYHHYDGKEDLMLSFLNHLKNCLEEGMCFEEDKPEEDLDRMIEMMMGVGSEDMWDFRRAVLEMKSVAPFNESFSEKIAEIDSEMKKGLEEKLREMEVKDTDEKADLMLSAIEGAVDRKLSKQEGEGLEEKKQQVKKIIDL